MNKKIKISILGVGYIGLPLAVKLTKHYNVIAFDKSYKRIRELENNIDNTNEIPQKDLGRLNTIKFTSKSKDIKDSDLFICCVPTPVNLVNEPDLSAIISACQNIGQNLKIGSVVVFESTVYPGVTEDICVKEIEKSSGFTWKKDFNIGYSPERVSPGDELRTIEKINKIISADTHKTLDFIETIYSKVVSSEKLVKVSSIKVAEAAKIIENIQRDVNIALVNEFSQIFNKLNINTYEVLKAAETKWNFHKFYPGLVGGHCIGVDPYYLSFAAKQIGFIPKIINAGREVNDYVPKYITYEIIRKLVESNLFFQNTKVNILGVTFKENCPDIRNSKVFDLISELKSFGLKVEACDLLADNNEVYNSHKIKLEKIEKMEDQIVTVLAVPHKKLISYLNKKTTKLVKKNGWFFDLKSTYGLKKIKDLNVWQL